MKLGFGEILIIFVVILFIIGPDKIPSFAKKIGEGLKAFRSATSDVTKELKENVVDPLNEASAPLREAMEPLEEMKNEINKSVSDIKKDVAGLNNPVKAPKAETPEDTQKEGVAGSVWLDALQSVLKRVPVMNAAEAAPAAPAAEAVTEAEPAKEAPEAAPAAAPEAPQEAPAAPESEQN